MLCCIFFFKLMTASVLRISYWSSHVCVSGLFVLIHAVHQSLVQLLLGRHGMVLRVGGPLVARFLAAVGPNIGLVVHHALLLNASAPRAMKRTAAGAGSARSPYRPTHGTLRRSEEHTSELQSLMRISYAVFCLKKKTYFQH